MVTWGLEPCLEQQAAGLPTPGTAPQQLRAPSPSLAALPAHCNVTVQH